MLEYGTLYLVNHVIQVQSILSMASAISELFWNDVPLQVQLWNSPIPEIQMCLVYWVLIYCMINTLSHTAHIQTYTNTQWGLENNFI